MPWFNLIITIVVILIIFSLFLYLGSFSNKDEKQLKKEIEKQNEKFEIKREFDEGLKDLININTMYSNELSKYTNFQNSIIKKSEEIENQFKTIFNNSPIGICRTTLSGQFIYVNNALIKMLGFFDSTELLSSKINFFTEFDNKNNIIKKLEKSPFIPIVEEYNITKKDGSNITIKNRFIGVLNDGELKNIDMIVEDISDIKNKERKLYEQHDTITKLLIKQQELNNKLQKTIKEKSMNLNQTKKEYDKIKNLYENMYKNAPIGLFRSSISTGKFITCNDATAKIFGLNTAEEFLNCVNALDIWGDKKRRDELIDYFKNLPPLTVYNHIDHCYTPISKEEKYIDVSEIANFEDDYFEGSFIDITESTFNKIKLEELNKKLEKKVDEIHHDLIEQYAYAQQLIAELEEKNYLLTNQKQILEQNRNKLMTIIKTIPDSLLIYNSTGMILEHYNIPENLSKNENILYLSDLFNNDNVTYLNALSRELLDESKYLYDGIIKEKYDNCIYWYEFYMFKINDNQLILIFRNVTKSIYTRQLLDSIIGSLQILTTVKPFKQSLYESLKLFGQKNGIQRSFIYKNNKNSLTSTLICEWHDELFFNLNEDENKNIDYRNLSNGLDIYNQLSEGKCIELIMKNIGNNVIPIVENLYKKGVKSLLCVPIIVQSEFLGYLGLSDYYMERKWTTDEKNILIMFTNVIGSIMKKDDIDELF